MSKAQHDLRKLNNLDASALLSEWRSMYTDYWTDVYFGPLSWIDCGENSSTYWTSLVTMLHEISHDLPQKVDPKPTNCLFTPQNKLRVCFNLAENLPNRSMARLSGFPPDDPKVVDAYERVQAVYMDATDSRPFLLFDELNAYTISSRALTAERNRLRKNQLAHTLTFLPLFLLYSVRYVEQLRQTDPQAYNQNFVFNTANWDSYYYLIDQGEKAFYAYQRALATHGEHLYPSELELFREYKRHKRALLTP